MTKATNACLCVSKLTTVWVASITKTITLIQEMKSVHVNDKMMMG